MTGKKALRPWNTRRTSLTGVTPRVLVVEDDPTVREITRRYLGDAGYVVDEAADGPAGLRSARTDPPDAVVLDVMLPGLSGLEVCRALRDLHPALPIVMLSALGNEGDRVAGLEFGADDYVTKPFSARELVLRVAAVLRRAGAATPVPAAPLVDGDLVVDPSARTARRGDADLPLTGREFDLLAFLLAHPGRAYNRAELLAEVWGWEFGDQSTVTVHVRRLREKIEPDPTHPRRIATVWGTGYRYDPWVPEMITDDRRAVRGGAAGAAVLPARRRGGRRGAAADPAAFAHRHDGRARARAARRRAGRGARRERVHVHAQLADTVVVCLVVAAVTVPAGLLLGRRVAREAMWQREAAEAERRSEESRRRLVAGMSHDLRSPLAGICGMADALVDGVVREPAEVRDYLGRIRREASRMTAMVEDLFQLSRATSGTLQLTLEPLALAEAASDAVAAESQPDVAVVAERPETWPTVLGSDTDLTRVLRNVLANAVRHTPAGGTVRLSAGARGGEAWLHVDDGCGGVPEADLPFLFDVGYRGSGARTPSEHSGAGLGLSIARGLMAAQGGGISLVNHGEGCRVEITLAVAAPVARVAT